MKNNEVEESGKSNELNSKKKRDDYKPGEPVFEIVVDGKTIRGFQYRSEALAWAIHNEPTLAFYHSGLWDVIGLDHEGYEKVNALVGEPFETKVRDIVLSKFQIRI